MKFLSKEKISNRRYKTPEGYLVCLDAIIARTGSQDYTKAEIFRDSDDDTIVKLYRPEKEVFSPQTMASFENKPFVDEHPDEDVNVDNHREYSIGFVRDVRRATIDGEDVLIANLVVTDAEAIAEIESGEKVELSCGYDCDILGEEPNLYQANIRGNHVALCKAGRAGIAKIQDSKIKDTFAYIVFKSFDSDKNYEKYKLANDYNIKQAANKFNVKVDVSVTRSGWNNQFTNIKMDVTGDRNQIEKFINYCITKLNLEIDKKQIKDSKIKDDVLVEGKTYTTKSGAKLKVKKVIAGYSEYNGKPFVEIHYDFISASGKKSGSSKCYAEDFFEMMTNPKLTGDSIKDSKIEKVAPELLLDLNYWFDDKVYIERKYKVKISNITSNQGLTISGSKENLEKLSKDFKIKQKIVDNNNMVKDSEYSELLKDLSPEERLAKIDELIADEEEAIVGYKEAMKYANEADKSIYAHIIAEELEHITELKTLRAENFEKNNIGDAGTTRRMFRESEVGDEDSWFGTTDWGTPKGNMYIYKKNGKIIAEGSYDGWHNALQKGEKKEFNSVRELNKWLNTPMDDSIKDDNYTIKPNYKGSTSWAIYKNGKYIENEDSEKEALARVEELKKEENKIKTYTVFYENSIRKGSQIKIKAKTEKEAIQEAKKKLGREFVRTVDIIEDSLEEKMKDINEEIIDNENVEVGDKLIEPEESYINEFKRDIQKMGFKIVKSGKTFSGRIHFQILSNEGDKDNADLKYYAQQLDRIEDKFNRYKIPITYSIGLQYDGYISAGVDLDKQYVKDSIKDTHFTVSSNRNSEEFNSEEELLKKYKAEGYDTVRGIKAPKLKGLMGPFFNGNGKILYETKERYNSYDSCKDEAIYKWMADPEDEQDLIDKAKKLGCQLQKVGSLIQVTGPISKIAKVLGESEESIIKASQQRMSTIKKVKDVDTYKEVTQELEKETKKLDSLKILKLINVAKTAGKVKDSDKLKQLAYKFAQMGNYFDRANSVKSRNILAKEDETKLSEFYKLGLEVYNQLKQEVDYLTKNKEFYKPGLDFVKNETYDLIYDGAERLYWTYDPKCKVLYNKLMTLLKIYKGYVKK